MLTEVTRVGALAKRIGGALARRERVSLLFGSVAMLVGALLTNLPALLLGLLVDEVLAAEQVALGMAAPYLALLGGALVGRQLADIARRYLVEMTATSVAKNTRHLVLEHLTRLPLAYFETHRTGEISGRVNRGVEGYVRILKLGFMDFLPACALAATAVVAALTRHLLLGLFMLAVVPVGLVIVILQIRSEKGIRLDIKATNERLDGSTLEILNGIEPIRAIAAENHVVAGLDIDLELVQRVELRHHLRMSLFDAAKFSNEGAFQIGVISVAVLLASSGAISPGEILTSALLFGSIVAPLRELHRILDEAHESALHAQDVFDLLDEPLASQFSSDRRGTPHETATVLAASGLSFTYPRGTEPAIRNVTLDVGRGEFIGICGASRSGKSTLARVLVGIEAADAGLVELQGCDLAELDHARRAAIIGYVPQTPWLFNATVFENITCGFAADIQAVQAAARLASIHDEIIDMRDGYDTMLSERGASLSGGQRQRIAIARALLRKPKVLVLDEATSALDNLTERAVMAAIEADAGLTVLAVAHRLTTLRYADRIVVMDDGRLIEQGRYDALLGQGGPFAKLVAAAERGGSTTAA